VSRDIYKLVDNIFLIWFRDKFVENHIKELSQVWVFIYLFSKRSDVAERCRYA